MLKEQSVALMRQLIDCIIEGLSRYGCSMMGIAYPDDKNPP